MAKKLVSLAVAVTVLICLIEASTAEAGATRGYFRKNGTYVQPYIRSKPDRIPYNNNGYPGNFNPNTGRTSTGREGAYLNRYYERKRPRTGR